MALKSVIGILSFRRPFLAISRFFRDYARFWIWTISSFLPARGRFLSICLLTAPRVFFPSRIILPPLLSTPLLPPLPSSIPHLSGNHRFSSHAPMLITAKLALYPCPLFLLAVLWGCQSSLLYVFRAHSRAFRHAQSRVPAVHR